MRIPLFMTLALAGTALASQSITGGLHTGLSLPMGDLKDRSNWGTNQFFGAHVGGHLDFNITDHHQVRAHLTLLTFPGSGWGGTRNFKNDFQILQGGADWVYSFQSPDRGWYTIAGATLSSLKNSWEATGASGSASQSGRVGVRGGGGYTFNRMFSLEGTLNQVAVDKNTNDGFGFDTATWIQASAVFRFGR